MQQTNTFRRVDAASGEIRDLFSFEQHSLAMVSPNGEWLVFLDHVPGKTAPGLFIARLDGTQRRLLAQLDYWIVGNPLWSPDGQWLAMTITNTDLLNATSTAALLNPDACQVVPLPHISGSILSWVLPLYSEPE